MLTSYHPHGQGRHSPSSSLRRSCITADLSTSGSSAVSFSHGCLVYVSMGTRPDIAYAVSRLSCFLDCYRLEHWNAAVRVVRYLKGTRTLPLVLGGDTVHLIGFADSDYTTTLTHVDLLVATASLSVWHDFLVLAQTTHGRRFLNCCRIHCCCRSFS